MDLAFQGTLLGTDELTFDTTFSTSERVHLAEGAWVDFVPQWLRGGDVLFGVVVDTVEWQSPMVRMWDKQIQQPRLSGAFAPGQRPRIVEDMRDALAAHYGQAFMTVGANLYRDGRDSVAWHGDRVARTLPEATIAIVSLGGTRRFLLRPRGGGKSVPFELHSGDLLVMGGSCQRTWQHSIPKVARAEPRISLTFRHRYDD